MRRKIAALAMSLLLVVPLGPSPVHAQQVSAEKGCIINIAGITICGELLEPLPTVFVPGPTVTLPPITVPGPVATVTIRPPTQTETVIVPGPETTVTVPGPESTVTVTPRAEPTPDAVPTETVTITPRQTLSPSDTLEEDDDSGFFEPEVDFGDGETTIGEVGIGTLTLLALVGLLLLTLYGGYILGYKDKERKETNFMRALLDQSKIGRGTNR